MLSNKRLVTVCGIAFCCNIAAIALFIKYNAGAQWYATIDERQEATVDLPDDFLSFGIDTSERLIFSGDDENISCDCNTNTTKSCYAIKRLCRHKFLPFFILTGSKWADINEFCIASGVKLLFSMNVMLRDQHNEWSETNAEEILEYSRRKGYSIDWQLGNEPNSFKHVFNISISPQMLAKDFKKLRKLLNHHGYKNSLLVGPDTTRPQPQKQSLEYMVQFLGNGSHAIDARSWHQYYLNSREAKLEDFWNPDTFNFLNVQIETMINHTKKYAHKPMWLTETSSSYGGGAPGLSNSYAGSPLWIDKLGLAAKYGIKVVGKRGRKATLASAKLSTNKSTTCRPLCFCCFYQQSSVPANLVENGLSYKSLLLHSGLRQRFFYAPSI
ncbi:heparanase-like [Phthorimaea operculella]|nr:heparanase-like [Phthorimaea operculella]